MPASTASKGQRYGSHANSSECCNTMASWNLGVARICSFEHKNLLQFFNLSLTHNDYSMAVVVHMSMNQ
jgi:hypothetical protein